jgi:dTDP-4-amino-4,6-dideoxygalactose transaminase
MKKKLNSNKKLFYPVSSPYITKKDIESVNRALKWGWISSDGPEIEMEIKVAYKSKKI